MAICARRGADQNGGASTVTRLPFVVLIPLHVGIRPARFSIAAPTLVCFSPSGLMHLAPRSSGSRQPRRSRTWQSTQECASVVLHGLFLPARAASRKLWPAHHPRSYRYPDRHLRLPLG